jgi:hypothetical protein
VPGVVYPGGQATIAEHGRDAPDDRDVRMLGSTPGADHASTVDRPVLITQIAPAVLTLLGLEENELHAVRVGQEAVLPGLG